MRARLPAALLAALTILLLTVTTAGPPATAAPTPEAAAAPMPTKRTWQSDVREAMTRSLVHLRNRVQQEKDAGGDPRMLAINLDIDNTSMATYYDRGRAVRATLLFAQEADRLGVQVFFNTGRTRRLRTRTIHELRAVGYELNRLCHREPDEDVTESKPRCRALFRSQGFTLIANVGNNPTDFVAGADGVDYERAYRLPNYGGRLS